MDELIKDIKFDVFLEGQLVDLVCLNEELVEKTNWYNWFNDEDNMKHMQKHYFPNTKEAQLTFLKKEIEGNTKKLQLGIVHKRDNVLIGTMSYNKLDSVNRKSDFSGFIGEKKYQNFKYFLEANKIFIKHGFDSLNLNRIYGGTVVKEVALLYYRVLGFKDEGVERQSVYKNGKYYDVYLIGLLREEYHKKFRYDKINF